MFIDNDVAYIRYPKIKTVVDVLVRADRGPGSEMEPGSREKISKTRKEFTTVNKLTFLVKVRKLLVYNNRNMKTMSIVDKVDWIKQV